MDHYADDLAAVIDGLDLRDVTLVGHSTGGGEDALNADLLSFLATGQFPA
jgi:pimeloyl-ACP methyl ester carboxylesterase